jgi:hypothetical protein
MNQSINQSANQSINQLTNQPTNQPTNQLINQSIYISRWISQSINQPTNQSMSQSINQLTNHSVNQPTNQPTNQSINQSVLWFAPFNRCASLAECSSSEWVNHVQCADIETRVLTAGVICRYCCTGHNCNRPPQLLPDPATIFLQPWVKGWKWWKLMQNCMETQTGEVR